MDTGQFTLAGQTTRTGPDSLFLDNIVDDTVFVLNAG